jgi:hypothetical protein
MQATTSHHLKDPHLKDPHSKTLEPDCLSPFACQYDTASKGAGTILKFINRDLSDINPLTNKIFQV